MRKRHGFNTTSAATDLHPDLQLNTAYVSHNMSLAQDAEMMEQIDRDVMRTHPDMHFFGGSDGAAVLHQEVLPFCPHPRSSALSSVSHHWWCEQLSGLSRALEASN